MNYFDIVTVVVAIVNAQTAPNHKLPEVCGLKPILRSKCPDEKSDDECLVCVLPFLKQFCHDLKPEPGQGRIL